MYIYTYVCRAKRMYAQREVEDDKVHVVDARRQHPHVQVGLSKKLAGVMFPKARPL